MFFELVNIIALDHNKIAFIVVKGLIIMGLGGLGSQDGITIEIQMSKRFLNANIFRMDYRPIINNSSGVVYGSNNFTIYRVSGFYFFCLLL